MIKEKRIVVIHESLIGSLSKDIFTFGLLGFMLYANVQWFGNHSIVALGFMILIIIALLGRTSKVRKDFYDKKSAIKFIEQLKQGINN